MFVKRVDIRIRLFLSICDVIFWLNNNQSLFVLTLAKEKITISMKIFKVKIRVLAWQPVNISIK